MTDAKLIEFEVAKIIAYSKGGRVMGTYTPQAGDDPWQFPIEDGWLGSVVCYDRDGRDLLTITPDHHSEYVEFRDQKVKIPGVGNILCLHMIN